MVPGQEYSGWYDLGHESDDDDEEEEEEEEGLFEWHLERLRLFVEEGLMDRVRYVAFETIPKVDEVRAVRRAVRVASVTTPFWVSCVFPREEVMELPDGSPVGEVVRAMVGEVDGGAVPWGIGVNCTKVHKLPALVAEFGECLRRLDTEMSTPPVLVLYPDGTNGEVYNTTSQKWELQNEKDNEERLPWEVRLERVVRDAKEKGPFSSFLVGGCCMASYHAIKGLRQQLRSEGKKSSD